MCYIPIPQLGVIIRRVTNRWEHRDLALRYHFRGRDRQTTFGGPIVPARLEAIDNINIILWTTIDTRIFDYVGGHDLFWTTIHVCHIWFDGRPCDIQRR